MLLVLPPATCGGLARPAHRRTNGSIHQTLPTTTKAPRESKVRLRRPTSVAVAASRASVGGSEDRYGVETVPVVSCTTSCVWAIGSIMPSPSPHHISLRHGRQPRRPVACARAAERRACRGRRARAQGARFVVAPRPDGRGSTRAGLRLQVLGLRWARDVALEHLARGPEAGVVLRSSGSRELSCTGRRRGKGVACGAPGRGRAAPCPSTW